MVDTVFNINFISCNVYDSLAETEKGTIYVHTLPLATSEDRISPEGLETRAGGSTGAVLVVSKATPSEDDLAVGYW